MSTIFSRLPNFKDVIFICIFLKENHCVFFQISMTFIASGLIDSTGLGNVH